MCNEVINGGYVLSLDSLGRLISGGEMRDTPTHDLRCNINEVRTLRDLWRPTIFMPVYASSQRYIEIIEKSRGKDRRNR